MPGYESLSKLPYAVIASFIGLLFSNVGLTADKTSFTLDIKGTVEQHCSLSGLSNDLVKLSLGGEKKLNFTVNCNTPFKYSLKSKFGGLKRQGSIPESGSTGKFLDITAYDISVKIPLEQGDKASIVDRCNSVSAHDWNHSPPRHRCCSPKSCSKAMVTN